MAHTNVVTIAAGALLVAAMLAGAYYAKLVADGRSALASVDPVEPATKVTVREVAFQSLPIRIDVRGFLEGVTEVRVHAEVTGRIAARNVDDGDALEAGDTLCLVDDTFHRIAVRQAEAAVLAAQARRDQAQAAIEAAAAGVEEAQVRQRNARIEFDRVRELHREQNAPQIEYDRAETALHQAAAAVRANQATLRRATQQRASATADIALARAQLARAAETLERCTIRSPLAGRVDRMLVEQGEYAIPGQPVADVIRLDRMKLLVELSGRQLALLGEGLAAELVPDALPGRTYRAALHHVAPRADPVSRKFRLELQVDNRDGALLSGMFAQCRLTASRSRRLLVLPASAVVRRYGADYCHVVTPDRDSLRARLRPIKTRPILDLLGLVELVRGVAPGERVVVESMAELRDGAVVAVVATQTVSSDLASSLPEVIPDTSLPETTPGG